MIIAWKYFYKNISDITELYASGTSGTPTGSTPAPGGGTSGMTGSVMVTALSFGCFLCFMKLK